MNAPATTVAVTDDDALDDVLARLREAGADGGEVSLSIPQSSALFLTASEFRLLKETVERGRLAVGIRTADPLRLQLARMLGLDSVTELRPTATPPRTVASPPSERPPTADPSPVAASPPSSWAVPAGHVHTAPTVPAAPEPAAADRATATVAPPGTEPGGAPIAGSSERSPSEDGSVPPPNGPAAVPPAAPPVALRADGDGNAEEGWPDPPTPVERPPRVGFRDRLRGASGAVARLRPSRTKGGAGASATAVLGHAAGGIPGNAGTGGSLADSAPSVLADAPTPPTRPVGDAMDGNGATPPPEPTGRVVASVATEVTVGGGPPVARRADRRWRLAARPIPLLVGLVLALAAAIAAAVALLLPRAEVAVELARTPVRAELLFDVGEEGGAPGAGADLAVAAEPRTVEVAFDGSIPTTGERAEPDGTAATSLTLRNGGAEEQTVDEGTVVATEDGREFAFTEAVDVPAADPDGGDAGSATAAVRALEPGTGGNVEAGALGGRLENGVYYSNRDGPASGGTDRVVRVVAEEDLETLRAEAVAAIPDLAERAFADGTDGVAVLPDSFEVGSGADAFDHEPGEETETLRLRAVRPVTALTYEPDALLDQARPELRDRLAAEAPRGYAVSASAVEIGTPAAVAAAGEAARFRLGGETEARAVLDDDERAALAERLAGKGPAEVEAVLADVSEIEGFDVDYRPAWLPDRMPGNAGRIAIEPDS